MSTSTKDAPKATSPEPVRVPAARHQFATFMILCPVAFFLGILYSQFPYDYPILWTRDSTGIDPFTTLETHLTILHGSPPLIPRVLHIIIAVGFFGFFMKLYRPTESNMLFDGASLGLYVIGVIIYASNIVKGLRAVSSGEYSVATVSEGNQPLGRIDGLRVLSATNTILALVLVGILVLQAGQSYAERKAVQEVEQRAKERMEKRAAAVPTKKKN